MKQPTISSDSVAQDRSIELVERYIRPLIPFAEARGYLVDRALVSCGRFFGVGRRRMRALVQRVERFGRSRAIEGRTLADIIPLSDYAEPEGFVYLARCDLYPHIVKVGWTSQPGRRVIGLAREAGTPVTIESLRPGTLGDETLAMLKRGADHITVEWFVDRSRPFGGLPPFMAKIESDQRLWLAALERVRRAAAKGDIGMGAHATLYFFALQQKREAA
jgi:hypothetical protein